LTNFQNRKAGETRLVNSHLPKEEVNSSKARFSFESIFKKAPEWLKREILRQEKKRQRHFKNLHSKIKSISKSGSIRPESITSNLKVKEFFTFAKSLEKKFESLKNFGEYNFHFGSTLALFNLTFSKKSYFFY
jgi:hypothetical protein